MNEELAIAARYRKYAENLRAAADFDGHAKTSGILRRIAFEFDLMAQTLEDIARTNADVLAKRQSGKGGHIFPPTPLADKD